MNKTHAIGIVIFWLVLIIGAFAYKGITHVTGTEIVLKTVPVDPRDLFRGDYVILSYDISNIDVESVYGEYTASQYGKPIYVSLDTSSGYGVVSSVSAQKPSGLFIVGTVIPKRGQATVEYGIESYFVPQGTGRELERARGSLEVQVMIDSFGRAAIKDVYNPQ